MVLRCCNTRLSARFDYRSLIATRSVRNPVSRTDSDNPFVERRSYLLSPCNVLLKIRARETGGVPFRNQADFLFIRYHPVHHGTIESYDLLAYLLTLLNHS